ncbi:MAG: PAS domain-containing protein [Nitrospirae bacterium]|nr:MAG: PAS domain-containing protein [Nitrospirota bacterium]
MRDFPSRQWSKRSLGRLIGALLGLIVLSAGVFAIGYSASESVLQGIGVAILITVPVGIWLVKQAISPLLDLRTTVTHLVAQGGLAPEEDGDERAWGRALTRLVAEAERRIATLESERAKLFAILESMVEGVIALDRQGKVMLMNPAGRRLLGLGPEPVEGQSLLEIIRNRGFADVLELCRTPEVVEPYRREVEVHTPVPRTLEVQAIPVPFEPHTHGMLLVFHDITTLRRLERMRAEFVANVSHELRTPLTAIKGYLETLLDESSVEEFPARYRRFLEVAHAHADRLGRLLDDLLNLSDLETGKVVLRCSSVALYDVVHESVAMFEQDASKKGLHLINRVPTHFVVHADRDRLSQILVNLLDNAVKYTPSGGSVTISADSLSDSQVVFRVQDTGQGIPPEALPRITERFYRVDKARSRELGGTGLGLAIVKHLVQLHGGMLHIESKWGQGTTVQVTLPATQVLPAS